MISLRTHTRDEDLGWGALMRRLASLDGQKLEVGVFPDEDPEVSEYAIINEFGAPNANIPKRPAFRSTFDRMQDRYSALAGQLLGEVLDGKRTTRDAFRTLGSIAVSDLQRAVERWNTPPNEDSTVENKGFNNPLVNTGRLLKAIAWRIV